MKYKRCLTVTELVEELNTALESQIPGIPFEGEASGVSYHGSGHLYFQVKDERSHIHAVMWRGSVQKLGFKVTEGLFVQCFGVPRVYNVTGKLQIDVRKIVPAGEGLLRKKFLELKAKLEEEGIFAPERKRQLPFFPLSIGVVTSAGGAVIHDIMVRIRERMPGLVVYLVDVRVQGEGAAQEIAEGVRRLDASGLVEVIIVARGGGSLQDLWAFNEEEVVRAIFASRTPVVSGVGHEVDVTLADFVADVRAPTPTAAAEMVVPRRIDLLERLKTLEDRLTDLSRWFHPFEQRLDELQSLLGERLRAILSRTQLTIDAAEGKLYRIHPEKVFLLFKARLDGAAMKLTNFSRVTSERAKQRLDSLSSRLESVNPSNVLRRGYAIVRENGRVIESVSEVRSGDGLTLSMKDGTVESIVSVVNPDNRVGVEGVIENG